MCAGGPRASGGTAQRAIPGAAAAQTDRGLPSSRERERFRLDRIGAGPLYGRGVFFFIDETWQEIGGHRVAALGAVAIRQAHYNAFCRRIYTIKKDVLGAQELHEAELKGAKCFANRAFRARQARDGSRLLDAVDATFDAMAAFEARAFVVWTSSPEYTSLRSARTTELSAPYSALLHDFRGLMERDHPTLTGSLNFDQRDLGSDEIAACAVQNYLVRTRRWRRWAQHFITVPNFTVSAVSPGLQAADLVAYLGAHCAPGSEREELQPFIERVRSLAVVWRDRRDRTHQSIRGVGVQPKK
jgi:hypothetical protein